MIHGLQAINYVLKNKYFTAQKMVDGFSSIGQHIPCVLADGLSETVCFEKMMTQGCILPIEPDKLNLYRDKLPAAIAEVMKSGRVTTEYLSSIGVFQDFEVSINRDNLTLCRQDALIVTHTDTVRKIREIEQSKRDIENQTKLLSDPNHQEAIRKVSSATKIIEREEKQRKKDEAKVAQQVTIAESKRIEKQKYAAMSFSEKQTYRLELKRKAEVKAEERATQKTMKLDNRNRLFEAAKDLLSHNELISSVANGRNENVKTSKDTVINAVKIDTDSSSDEE